MKFSRSSLKIERILIVFQILITLTNAQEAKCNYDGTVELDETKGFKNGSYMYDDFLVEPEYVTEYDYKILIGDIKTTVPVHKRGCTCEIRPCVSLCCPSGQQYDEKKYCVKSYTPYNENVNVTEGYDEDDVTKMYPISAYFSIQFYRPCEKMYFLRPNEYDTDGYTLYDNGTLLRHSDNKTLKKNEYCFSPFYEESSKDRILLPVICHPKADSTFAQGVVMATSVPLMILSIFFLIIVPRYNRLVYKCMCCYLFSLSVGFTTLSVILLMEKLSDTVCKIVGYTTYIAIIASYSWLAAMNFIYFWGLIKEVDQYRDQRTFILSSIFGWGFPTVAFAIVIYAQDSSWVSSNFKPNIGTENNCFFDKTQDSQINIWIYYFIPSATLILFTFLVLILGFLKMNYTDVKTTNQKLAHGFRNKLSIYVKKYGMHVRISLTMGVCWTLEILQNIYTENKIVQRMFYVVVAQGYIIFIAIITRKETIVFVRERFRKLLGRNTQDFGSGSRTRQEYSRSRTVVSYSK